MTTLAFFNGIAGVGRTTLVYHLAHMLADQGVSVLMLDLDPQSNLSAMCLDEDQLERLWPDDAEHVGTAFGCIRPVLHGLGDIAEPNVEVLRDGLGLVPGDVGLSTFEDELSGAWTSALAGKEAAYRTLSAFHQMGQRAARAQGARLTLIDVGPNLGAINRAVLLAADDVVIPLAPDPFSVQGLRNLGPILSRWREHWKGCLERRPDTKLELPPGSMDPLGYIVMQASMRLSRPVKAYHKWISRLPREYHHSLLLDDVEPGDTESDPHCMGVMHHYLSLVSLALDARKPMFHLKPADGANGAYMPAVERCRTDFEHLARVLLERLDAPRS